MTNPHLPQEILFEIFSKLPTKSVGRCRTLSKYWKTHLSTPNFIKKHLISRKQTIQQENLALVTKETDVLCIITSPTKSDQLIDDESFSDSYYSIRGSCNGLILLDGLRCMVLLNPITLKKLTFLTPNRKGLGYCDRVYGLGYDSCTDDYKIVVICGDGLVQTYVDVYSVKNGVWKTLDDGCYPYDRFVPKKYECEGGAFVNGSLHYLLGSNEGYRNCIAAFDLATEVFSEIHLPREFVRQPEPREFVRQPGSIVECFSGMGFHMPRSNGVSVVGGCLSIVDNVGNGVSEVWIMTEYGVEESWVKFSIQTEDRDRHSIAAMLCYVEDGELLYLTSWDNLFARDLKNGTTRNVVLGGCDYSFSHGTAFVDSLVSPE